MTDIPIFLVMQIMTDVWTSVTFGDLGDLVAGYKHGQGVLARALAARATLEIDFFLDNTVIIILWMFIHCWQM